MSSSDSHSTRLYRWRKKKEQEDLQAFGRHGKVRRTLQRHLPCQATKDGELSQTGSLRAQPHLLHRHLTPVYRLSFYFHRVCSILTDSLLSTHQSSIIDLVPRCRALQPPSTFLASVPRPAPATLLTSLSGMYLMKSEHFALRCDAHCKSVFECDSMLT